MLRIALATLMLLGSWTVTSRAQEQSQSEPHADVDWYEAWYVKFKSVGFYEAERILRDHFVPVEQAIGRESIIIEYRTGHWDFVIYFPIDGPGDLEQRTSPTWELWWKILVEREGEEGAERIQARLDDLIADSENHLVERWRYGMRGSG
jgi:hypothetical protein